MQTIRRRADNGLLVLAGLAGVTALALAADRLMRSPAAAGWLYLLVVLPVTLRWGRAAGVVTAVLAGVLLLGLLTEPHVSLSMPTGSA